MKFLLVPLILLASTAIAMAGEATVERVEARQSADGSWRFDVTVAHADTGWEHYADAFVVSMEDGTPLGTRTLFHPHVNEQPFTRSLTGVQIPEGTTAVLVHAKDNVDGDGTPVRYELPR